MHTCARLTVTQGDAQAHGLTAALPATAAQRRRTARGSRTSQPFPVYFKAYTERILYAWL